MAGVVALYSDGGTIYSNPSPHGVTWAWCGVDANGNRIIERSGFVPAAEMTTNNQSEFLAATLALEAMPAGWAGTLHTDSRLTIERLFEGRWPTNIPAEVGKRAAIATGRMGKVAAVLMHGHPTKAEIAEGKGKSGRPASIHNQWCDEACGRESEKYFALQVTDQETRISVETVNPAPAPAVEPEPAPIPVKPSLPIIRRTVAPSHCPYADCGRPISTREAVLVCDAGHRYRFEPIDAADLAELLASWPMRTERGDGHRATPPPARRAAIPDPAINPTCDHCGALLEPENPETGLQRCATCDTFFDIRLSHQSWARRFAAPIEMVERSARDDSSRTNSDIGSNCCATGHKLSREAGDASPYFIEILDDIG